MAAAKAMISKAEKADRKEDKADAKKGAAGSKGGGKAPPPFFAKKK